VPVNRRKTDMIRKLFGATLCMLTLGSTLSAQDHAQCAPTDFLVSVGELTSDLSHDGFTSGDSILVLPDGWFQLQRRKQQMSDSTVTQKIFQSRLNEAQMQRLRNFLESPNVRDLPPYVTPQFPVNAPWFGMFDVKIRREKAIQRIGFWVWRGGTSNTPPNSTPMETKKIWQDSQIALQPLVPWLHEVEAMKLEPSVDAKPMHVCDAEEMQN
jgi:hypothetical protein